MKIEQVQGTSFNLNYFNKNQIEKENINKEVKIDEKQQIIDHRKLSNDESKNLYYVYQVSNLMKSKIEIYMNLENEDKNLSYETIRDVQKREKRDEILEYYRNEVKLQESDSKYEMWA